MNVVARGVARAPASCGELAQGLFEHSPVMVTCPLDLYSTATVDLQVGIGQDRGPQDCRKAVEAVSLTLDHLGRSDLDATLTIDSPIPRKKGMGSSTADIVSGAVATATALGASLEAATLAEIALSIEPSDGIMLPGIALFDHVGGRIRRSLGDPPSMAVLVLEFEQTLDTEDFNSTDRRAALRPHEAQFRESLALIEAGIHAADPRLIGRGATLNAEAYQSVLHKPRLPEVRMLAEACGAVGVNVAHSGTVIGLLFAGDGKHVETARDLALRRLPGLIDVHKQRLIGGGAETLISAPPQAGPC